MVSLSTVLPATLAMHDPNDFWFIEETFPGVFFFQVHGSSSTNVITVGCTAGNVFAARFQGTVWTDISPTTLAGCFESVWVASPTLAFATTDFTGTQNKIYKWDGTTWSVSFTFPTSTGGHNTVWGSSTTDAWASSIDGLYRWNGVSWTLHTANGPISTEGILHGAAANDVWLVTTTTQGRHYTGTTWDLAVLPGGGDLVGGIGGAATNDIFYTAGARGFESAVNRWNGAAWVTEGNVFGLAQAVCASSASEGWIGTTQNLAGEIMSHRSGPGQYQSENFPTSDDVTSCYSVDSANAWAVTDGGQIFSWQSNPTVSAPTVSLAESHELDDFNIVADAHCNGDWVSFRVLVDLNSALTVIVDMDVTIGDSRTSVWIQSFDDSQMFQIGSKLWFFSAPFPPGEYVAHARVDVNGLGGFVDAWDATAFVVGQGTCLDTPFDDSELRAFIIERTNQTNGYVNTTSADTQFLVTVAQNSIQSQLTSVHSHLDGHFNTTNALIVNQFLQTNGYINLTRIQILEAIGDISVDVNCGANQTENCTFEAQSIVDFPGLTDEQVGAFLLFFVVLILSFFQRWLFVAIACVIGILDVFVLGGIFGFEFTALLLVIAVMLQIYVDHRDAHREEQAQREAKQEVVE